MADRRRSLANRKDGTEDPDLIDLNSPVVPVRRRRLFDENGDDIEANGEDAEDKEPEIHFNGKNSEVVYEACGSYVNTYRRSPIMSSSMMEDAHGADGEILTGSIWPRSSSLLDISHISNISLEALAGNSNSELEENGQPDLAAEISDLNLRLVKQGEDNASLKNRLTEAQEDYFNVLQNQRDELDKKSLELKGMNERVKRLERELNDKNQQVSSLEDRNTVLYNRITRLENECSSYQKERKELYLEIEELKGESKKSLQLLTKKEEEMCKIQVAAMSAEELWSEKVKWLNEQVEPLRQTVDELSQRIEELQLEKLDLESQNKRERGIDHYQSPALCQLRELSHLESFDVMDVSSDDIETELLVAEGRFPPDEQEKLTLRFDVAIQCGNLDEYKVLEQDVNDLYTLLTEISEMLYSIRHMTLASSSTGNDDELCKVDQIPNGSGGGSGEPITKGKKKKNKGEQVNDAQQESGATPSAGNKESDQLSESNATVVVRQINQELAEFREQLKKSQELFSVLRFNSTQSISLTKSCPGLTVDQNEALSKSSSTNHNNKSVSCGTQTDSPVIETPVLAQKLALRSASTCAATQLSHQDHHHHHLNLMMSGGGLPDFMTNDSMDNPSFDKLSDDGSVRVRDDLSMVLEVSEQETETSPGAARRTMSFDKGSINRPKLTRMPNATEEEEPHCSHSSNNSNHHHNHNNRGVGSNSNSDHLNVEDGITSDNDYVSATSSQAESVYLSLERPLKVTVSSKEGDRSSGGNYRSCASSISGPRSRAGTGCGSALGYNAPDCDTASLVSEGNTTFGSPLSSPSSPYWTPSQGSSSQETITPLDGDRTPVNEEVDRQYHSSTEICSASYRRSPFMGSPSQSEPSDYRRMGVIPQSELPTMLQNAYDPVGRATNPYAKFLSNEEWQQLRRDQDLNDEEAYRKQFAQEEGNEEDGGAGGVEGAPQKSASAFALDEEAEKYLELLPKLVEELFQTFDVMRDKKQAPTKEDLENLERKFNHMAEVFQTDHTNLEQRITALSKDYKESQVKLKEFSQSLKSSISRLKEISKSNGTVPDDLLEVIKTLNSTSEEFEMYSDTMRRISRRMGMMDVQNRLHKMLDVMILYVHIIRTNYDNLQTDYIKAKKLLEENNVAFSGNRALGPLQNNNNNDEKCLWDEEELENSHSDRCDDGDSEPEKILQHLLGPKKSSAGLNRKERPILKEKRSSDSLLVRWMAEGYEVLRRELFWPWNLEQTIKGLKQGFSVILMILGLFVFLRGFLPSVSAIDDGCMTNPSFFKSIGEYFSYCGDLSHDDTPVI